MAIKALIPANQNTVTVGGLYQWDYGQVLEIECAELGSEIMEVHFACRGMTEAIVRPCTFANGVGTVTIPDRCLEQASNITAWVYQINSTQGHTVKVITLSVVERTRPSKSQDVPTDYVNQYAEALTEINEAINALENGTVTVATATRAISADSATTATSAVNATRATSAGRADRATSADYINLNIDRPHYNISLKSGFGSTTQNFEEGIYLVTYTASSITLSGMGYIGGNNGRLNHYSISLGRASIMYQEYVDDGAGVTLFHCGENDNPVVLMSGVLKFYKLSDIING